MAWDILLLIPGQIELQLLVPLSPGYFNSEQYRDSHISTCLIKTHVIYLYCVYGHCASYGYLLFVYRYSLFIYLCSLSIVIINLFHALFDFHSSCCSTFVLLRLFCFSLFIVHCSKEKLFILILDCIPGISILRTTSSMWVNKYHTADCTDFVLV